MDPDLLREMGSTVPVSAQPAAQRMDTPAAGIQVTQNIALGGLRQAI